MEHDFLEDLCSSGRSIVSIGEPESGKSYLMLKYLKFSIINEIYDSYHLILPCYKREQNNSYSFLKGMKNVMIYNRYDPLINENVNNDVSKGKKVFYAIDDGTGQLMNNNDRLFVQLYTTTRHGFNGNGNGKNGGVTFWIIVHSAKTILKPLIRQNTRYFFLYSLENAKLLEGIYDEMLSLRYRKDNKKFQDFLQEYYDTVKTRNYGVMLITKKQLDFNVNSWRLLK